MREREQRCGTCAHARKYEYQPVVGTLLAAVAIQDHVVEKIQCRRFPPVVVHVSGDHSQITAWPLVHDTDWCGEWKQPPGPAD